MIARRQYPKWLVRGLVVFAIAMTALAAVASREHHSAENQRNAALSRLVALEARNLQSSDPALGMQLALIAYHLSQTTDARSALLDVTAGEMPTRLLGRPGRTLLALGDDAHRLAIAYQADDQVDIYKLHFAQLSLLSTVPGSSRSAHVDAVAVSHNGHLLATGDSAGHVTLWSLVRSRHPKELTVLRAGNGAVHSLVFSPGGVSLAAADADGRVQRWSLRDPSQPALATALVAPGRPALAAVSYSHDGRTLAATGDHGALVIWPAHGGGKPVATAAAGAETLTAVSYSPDGKTLATGGRDGAVELWSLSARGAPTQTGTTLAAGGSVTALAFSRDGRYLTASTTARSAPIWSTSGWARVASLPHQAAVTGVAFTDGDRQMVSADMTGTTMIWQVPAPSTHTFGSALTGLSYSTTAPRLAVTTKSGRTDEWDVVSEWRPAPVGSWYAAPLSAAPAHAYWITTSTSTSTTTTAAGATTTAAGGTATGTASVVVNPHAGDLALRRTRAATTVTSSILSANGELFAAGGADRLVWVWDVSDPASPQLLARLSGFTARVTSVLFSTNSQTVFAGSADHTIRMWSFAELAKPRELSNSPLIGPSTAVTKLALSPDGRTLAAATIDGRVWLWSVASPAKASLSASLTAARGRLTALTFSPSDNILVAGGANRRLTFWHYRPYQAVNRICALEGTPITPNEWQLYVPGAAYKPPCAKWTPPLPPAAGASGS
jgi:WD40 repeat protein